MEAKIQTSLYGRNLNGVVANVLDYEIVVSEFEL